MSKPPKSREPNLLESEKLILLSLVRASFHIVENKKTDGVTKKEKNEEWENIARKFAQESTIVVRSADFLKQSWTNIKKRMKGADSAQKVHVIGTGGGPPGPKKNVDLNKPEDELAILLKAQVEGFNNPFDSDSVFLQLTTDSTDQSQSSVMASSPSPQGLQNVTNAAPICFTISNTEKSRSEDWSTYNPQKPRQRKSAGLEPFTDSHIDMLLDNNFENDDPDDPMSNSTMLEEDHRAKNVGSVVRKESNTSEKAGLAKKRPGDTDRRRPLLPQGKADQLYESKRQCIEALKVHCDEEHKLTVLILQERLKQEQMRT